MWLVDTPGLDDTYRSDSEILVDIAAWLAMSYEQRIRLTGIIYIQRITDSGITDTSFRSLAMLKHLCGDDALSNIVLATTFWEICSSIEDAVSRETELMNTEALWGYFLDRGSVVFRHYNRVASAEAVVEHLLKAQPLAVLQIQKEIVEEGKRVDETSAGKALAAELSRQLDEEIGRTLSKKGLKNVFACNLM